MRAQLLKIPMPLVNSFSIRRDILPYVNNHWHYHREIELVYIKNGSGTQFIGDSVRPFKTGQAVLIGGHLPHYWKFDDVYFSTALETTVDVIVIHFNNDFFGESFLNLPENKIIRKVLQESRKGIQIDNSYGQQIGELMENIFLSVGTKRLLLLLEILTIMGSELKSITFLSPDFQDNAWVRDNSPISNIYNFILANFNKKISTEQLAGFANISVPSFSRYFKAHIGMTYKQFLLDVRVGHACKLLIEGNMNVKQIRYECGFQNVVSFHKQFKEVTGKSPLEYQKFYFANIA
ncbi:AraC family transcriptional regulator [Pedobacter cryoconitis]|uniref:AraC-like DNA-binding protein n=1 Tax=Pedobacter cryoconitis TaxID=188932 RepID=A0A7X0J2K1_9SPHI|nr:AraC family transcriptional regulator [Pedobacter cryoconitis]MBB6499282.1 AraC-like DNA-binding protein [Pedobacter cryoconitis]